MLMVSFPHRISGSIRTKMTTASASVFPMHAMQKSSSRIDCTVGMLRLEAWSFVPCRAARSFVLLLQSSHVSYLAFGCLGTVIYCVTIIREHLGITNVIICKTLHHTRANRAATLHALARTARIDGSEQRLMMVSQAACSLSAACVTPLRQLHSVVSGISLGMLIDRFLRLSGC